MPFIIATFYHFFDFSDCAGKHQAIKEDMQQFGICGSLLLAPEGFNATLAGSRSAIDEALAYLKKLAGADFRHKESSAEKKPFKRLRVRLKKETISIGKPAPLDMVGTYVDPKEWNQLIADPEVIVLDSRNVYETHLGSFQGAIDPKIRNFKHLPDFVQNNLAAAKDKKIATFCTGGIRCEKFTSWLRAEGFENVYHLNGGILRYLEEIPPQESLWQGECFVFDERVAVGHGLVPSKTASVCYGCGQTLTPEDRANPLYVSSESCQFCATNRTDKYSPENCSA